jgi:hypothetical protein
VVTRPYAVTGPFWASRVKALITSWIPYCVDQCNRTDILPGRGDGGIDNFLEAAKALRGEPYAAHKGYERVLPQTLVLCARGTTACRWGLSRMSDDEVGTVLERTVKRALAEGDTATT